MSNRRKLANRLAALLKKYDREIERTFLQAVQDKAASINLAELTNAIEARDLNRALRIAGLTRAELYPFDAEINGAYVAGGQTIPEAAPAFALKFGFDGRASHAAEWARTHVGGLVTDIADEQVELLRETIAKQLEAGEAPRSVAVRIAGRTTGGKRQGGFIGLSRSQIGYLANARQELEELNGEYFTRKLRDKRFDGIVRKAIATGKPLSVADVERIAGRYSDRMLKHRADTIARTESITALRAGRREGMLQGIEAGAIRADRVKRIWDSSGDNRVRADHRAMDGREVDGMDTPYTLPDGSRMLFPGDASLGAPASQTVACRCYEVLEIDWLTP
ncbi:hypothetical protein HME9302_00978 [Alteripontixanthobacter maritimus]|uniref:Phage head morphogenesis domain-containing protein n=1 Tax=Alteripontixanthobacter maritimus TaxID=2161824 RepID=A0A369Q4G6_9SPHN|nr:phage minor head protein [Alteripontixanthobacter maritimus]RDC59783.1 hypothetical protein HME9302_00978 [Alteripontixanthobacter maritimus]